MATTHNLGFPRIGKRRELKFALEAFWRGESDIGALRQVATDLRAEHWRQQSALDWVPVGDFSFYDQTLDMSFLLGNLPERARRLRETTGLDRYFHLARGRSAGDAQDEGFQAATMTKWFDTNYHYITPGILQRNTVFPTCRSLAGATL